MRGQLDPVLKGRHPSRARTARCRAFSALFLVRGYPGFRRMRGSTLGCNIAPAGLLSRAGYQGSTPSGCCRRSAACLHSADCSANAYNAGVRLSHAGAPLPRAGAWLSKGYGVVGFRFWDWIERDSGVTRGCGAPRSQGAGACPRLRSVPGRRWSLGADGLHPLLP